MNFILDYWKLITPCIVILVVFYLVVRAIKNAKEIDYEDDKY